MNFTPTDLSNFTTEETTREPPVRRLIRQNADLSQLRRRPSPKQQPRKAKKATRQATKPKQKKKIRKASDYDVQDPDEFYGLPPQPPGQENLEEVLENMRMMGNPEFVMRLRQDKGALVRLLNHINDNLRTYLNATNKRIVLRVGNRYITLSRASLMKLLDKIDSPFKEADEVSYDSWQWIETIITERRDVRDDMEFKILDRPDAPDNDGGFFDKLNVSPFDLTELGILSRFTYDESKYVFIDHKEKLPELLKDITKDHCIVSTLKYFGLSEDKLDVVRQNINCNLKKTQLKKIADLLEIQIKLHHYQGNNKPVVYEYNRDSDEIIHIALYNNHYFPYIDMDISPYMASNWKEVYEITDYTEITNYDELHAKFNIMKYEPHISKKNGKYYQRNVNAKINSLSLVKRLDESGAFVTDNVFEDAPEMTQVKGRKINLNCIDDECRDLDSFLKQKEEKKKWSKESKKNKVVFYADSETITKKVDKNIKPFKIGICDSYYNVNIYKSLNFDSKYLMESIMYKAITHITVKTGDEIIIYFHNLKFDKTFFDQLTVIDKCKKDGQYYSIKVLFRGRIIEFRDSYKLIPSPLSKFGGMFNIECAKQVIPYKLYTEDSIHAETVDIRKAIEELEKQLKGDSDMDKKIDDFLKSASEFIVDDQFSHMEYMDYYLKMDCITLGKGLSVFGDKIREVTGLETVDCLTISSLMYKYCLEQGVFKGQYQVTGNLKKYIGNAVYGGRVATRYNKKHHIKTIKKNSKKFKKTDKTIKYIYSQISDFDGVSLYPSAIVRLCAEMGIPCGKPRKLSKNDLKKIAKNPNIKGMYYIVDVKITKIGKNQQIPFVCYKNENGCEYTNVVKDQILTIDCTTLQDWVEFQEIEYEVQSVGVKWTKFNKKFGEVIKTLFEARLECKKKMGQADIYTSEEIAGFNALQQIYKLMLNSAYGKTIIKSSDQKTVFLTRDKGHTDEQFEQKMNNYIVKNYNRIKCVTKYQNYIEIKEIESYRTTYNLAHVGVAILSMSKRIMNEVMNVITDLDKPCYYQDTDSMLIEKDDVPLIETKYRERYNRELIGKQLGQFHNDFVLDGAKDIYSNELIILGKKCYMNVIQGVGKDGEIITGEHIRMKGVNRAGMLSQKEKLKSNKKIYEELFEGKELEFDLLYGGAFSIKYTDDHNAEERGSFVRKLKF